jgi:hypothetical protein
MIKYSNHLVDTSEQQYLSDSRIDWEGVIGLRLPKSSTKHQTLRGGLQRPGQGCHPWGYHNYPYVWEQTQVNSSLDTTSTLAFTTLITLHN